MNYRLVLLTHSDAPTLDDTIASFAAMVTPAPSSRAIVHDGSGDWRVPAIDDLPWLITDGGTPRGFCATTRDAWDYGSRAEEPFVFYLEHDFTVTCPLDLRPLAAVLDSNRMLAQMALMRDAVNTEEKAAGGLFESRPGQYADRGGWLEHTAYLTTNPSLMRREFMAENPWPEYESECEGRFGIDLVARGYTFGVWGAGEPWVEHTGARTGFGY